MEEEIVELKKLLRQAFLREVYKFKLRGGNEDWERSRQFRRFFALTGDISQALEHLPCGHGQRASEEVWKIAENCLKSYQGTDQEEQVKGMSCLDFLLWQKQFKAARLLVYGSGDRLKRWEYALKIFRVTQEDKDLNKAWDFFVKDTNARICCPFEGERLEAIMTFAEACPARFLKRAHDYYLEHPTCWENQGKAEYWQRRYALTGEQADAREAEKWRKKWQREEGEAERKRQKQMTIGEKVLQAGRVGDRATVTQIAEKHLDTVAIENPDYFDLAADILMALKKLDGQPGH